MAVREYDQSPCPALSHSGRFIGRRPREVVGHLPLSARNLRWFSHTAQLEFLGLLTLACSSVPSRILSLQENPQATKKEEVEGADSHSDQRPETCQSPEQKGKEVSLDGSQYTPSPASQEDLESDVSDDSDQEVDIEGDKGYYNAAH